MCTHSEARGDARGVSSFGASAAPDCARRSIRYAGVFNSCRVVSLIFATFRSYVSVRDGPTSASTLDSTGPLAVFYKLSVQQGTLGRPQRNPPRPGRVMAKGLQFRVCGPRAREVAGKRPFEGNAVADAGEPRRVRSARAESRWRAGAGTCAGACACVPHAAVMGRGAGGARAAVARACAEVAGARAATAVAAVAGARRRGRGRRRRVQGRGRL